MSFFGFGNANKPGSNAGSDAGSNKSADKRKSDVSRNSEVEAQEDDIGASAWNKLKKGNKKSMWQTGAGVSAVLVIDAIKEAAAVEKDQKQRDKEEKERANQEGGGGAMDEGTDTQEMLAAELVGSNDPVSKEKIEFARGLKEIIGFLFFCTFFMMLLTTLNQETSFAVLSPFKDNILGDPVDADDEDSDVEFYDIYDREGVWDYLTGTFLEATFNAETTYGDPVPPEHQNDIMHYNHMLGAIRVSQTRVVDSFDECYLPPAYQEYIGSCYKTEDNSDNDDQPYGPDLQWKAENGEYFWDLDTSMGIDNATAMMEWHKNNYWIDDATREVLVTFTMFNDQAGMYVVTRLKFEQLPSSGFDVSTAFRVLNPMRHMYWIVDPDAFPPTATNYFFTVVEFMFDVFVTLQLKTMVMGMYRKGFFGYFKSVWMLFDLLNIAICFLTTTWRCQNAFSFMGQINLDPEPGEFMESWRVADLQQDVMNWTAFNVILTVMKLLKYLRIFPTIAMLTDVLNQSTGDMSSFMCIFFMVFAAYAKAFEMAFGSDISDFMDLTESIFTLMQMILGEFDFGAILEVNAILGPILFLSYIVVVVFVLVNMFLAILGYAYDEVMEKGGETTDEFVLLLRNGWHERMAMVMEKFRKRSKLMYDIANSAELSKDLHVAMNKQLLDIDDLKVTFGSTSQSKHVMTVCKRPDGSSCESMEEAFDIIDADHSGFLDPEELGWLMGELSKKREEDLKAKARRTAKKKAMAVKQSYKILAEQSRDVKQMIDWCDRLSNRHVELINKVQFEQVDTLRRVQEMSAKTWKVWHACDM